MYHLLSQQHADLAVSGVGPVDLLAQAQKQVDCQVEKLWLLCLLSDEFQAQLVGLDPIPLQASHMIGYAYPELASENSHKVAVTGLIVFQEQELCGPLDGQLPVLIVE